MHRASVEEHAPPRLLRVCFVIDRLTSAGTERQLLTLLRSLDRARVSPYLCLLRGDDGESRAMEPTDCPVLRLGVGALKHPSTLVKAWRFMRFLRHERIDVVQTFFHDSTYFGVPAAKLAGVPCVIRSRRSLAYWSDAWHRRLSPIYGRLVDLTLVNCEACRQEIFAQERPAEKSVLIHRNGVDFHRFENVRLPERRSNGRPRRVGALANLRPVKGPDVFLGAAKLLRERHSGIEFPIAGGGSDWEWDWVREVIQQQGLDDCVRLLGPVEDVPEFLAGLDVAVLASRSEGLSNAILEYMAAGRPIVATSVGGNVELIEHGVNGLLVPSEDAQAMADAIDRLLDNPELAYRLASEARRRVIDEFSLEATARRFEAVCRNALRTKQSAAGGVG